MTSPLRPSLLFDEPGDLLAALPSMLCFVPADSLILVTYTGRVHLHLESVLRLDLPAPEHYADVLAQLRIVARNHAATVVELAVLSDTSTTPPALPHRDLIDKLIGMLAADGVDTAHACWAPNLAAGTTWWCYEDPECSGQIADPDTSPIAAVMSAAGIPTHPTREALAARLAPDPPDTLAHRAELLATLPPPDPEQAFPRIRTLIDTAATPDDATLVEVANALTHADVREACLALTLTPRAGPAEHLWLALTRAVPAPARADPASLLAVSAYLRGEGALATLAVDAALAANPAHPLAQSIRHAMDYGFTPDTFRLLLAQSFIDSFTNRHPAPADT